jgi:hypothetical protein
LSRKYKVSVSTIQRQISGYNVINKVYNSRSANLICDTTFYGKKKDRLGTVILFDCREKEALIWRHVEAERVKEYKTLLNELINLGYTILSLTIDGRRGLNTVFKAYRIEMCHFHQKQMRIISRKDFAIGMQSMKIF